ncbi:ABC transporter substrate-binding protein [Telmatospirillum sp.]|uniref:ABC transporter substrate-binding protein n=1 Tax=Telmatospirillum sp. TaxID=2079197 RepID=UPI00283EE98E|nr:ABC transporter substrate-binding protein [Telmatospirillum sp.]MDR3436089.1 ABC transporter substrate-binding protein [Telmatospirillum sp.]
MAWRVLSWTLVAMTGLALAIALARPPIRLAEPSGGRQIEDSRHRTISVATPFPGSMLLFPPLMAEYFLATAAPETVLATTSINRASLDGGLLDSVFPGIGKLAANRTFPTPHAVNLEAAMAARPGAIFIMAWLAPPLDAIGLPTVAVGSAPREEMIFANAQLFAKTAGRPDRAATLIRAYQQAMTDVAGEVEALGDKERPSLLDLTIMADGGIRVQGPQSLSSRLMARAGGRNALTSGISAPRLSAEHILSLNPDVILLAPNSATTSAKTVADTAPWNIFPASRHSRVYRQPNGIASGLGGIIESPLEVRWLAELLHPDRLAPRLRGLMAETYRGNLQFSPSEDQLDHALAIEENRGMARYQRFARTGTSDVHP